jgi:dihydrodipicolinate synthase/N-acetylneuraminate lyase
MNLNGVFPPMVTPFDDGAVDRAAIRANVDRWLRAGVRGVLALGSTGEAPLLTEDESDAVIAAARDALPSTHVLIAGTGRESTAATIDASRRAAAIGANAVMVRTPSFYKGRMTHDAFVTHYTAVADASPVPVFLYNIPAVTGLSMAVETVAKLAQHPNIGGIKETSTDAGNLAAYIDATPAPPAFTAIVGSALVLYPALCLGARAAILGAACVVPDACLRIMELVEAGRHQEARALQTRLTPLGRLVTVVHGIPGLKAAMDLAGYRGGAPRLPLTPPSPAAVEQIRAALDAVMAGQA